MMKKGFTPTPKSLVWGFTLLELVVVIIILGVLATLGFTQYGRMVERGRQAEAKQILGDIRKLAVAYRLENGTIAGFSNANANIGTASDQLPPQGSCRSPYWFSYATDYDYSEQKFWACAYRCTSGGKSPQGPSGAYYICLTTYLDTGIDIWGGSGDY